VQTCSKCNASSPDYADTCVNCDADLRQFSATAVALKEWVKTGVCAQSGSPWPTTPVRTATS